MIAISSGPIVTGFSTVESSLDAPRGNTPSLPAPNPEGWVDEHGEYLFTYAVVRVRDSATAEDLVQETFLAGIKSGSAFAGRSTERTWLTAILKNKILDHFRRASRQSSFTDLEFFSNEEGEPFIPEGLFKDSWIHNAQRSLGPLEWPSDRCSSLDSEEFWKAFHNCASKLPKNVSTVFMMREVDATDSKDICRTLNISESNLWVMLHRARMALRRCLETNWFVK